MSREIDFSRPLSAEDEAYAAERPWLRQDAELAGTIYVAPEGGEDEGGESEDEDVAYEDMTNDQLKDLLKERELAVSGPKEALIERLEAYDAEHADEEEEEDDES